MLASLLLTAAAGAQRLIRCYKTYSALLHQAPACRQRKTCIDPWSKVQSTSSKEQYTWSKKQYTRSKVQRTGPYSLPSQHTLIPGPDSVEAQALHYCIMNQTEKLPFSTLDPWPKAHCALSPYCFCGQFHEWVAIELESVTKRDLTMRSYAAAWQMVKSHPNVSSSIAVKCTQCIVCKQIAVGWKHN